MTDEQHREARERAALAELEKIGAVVSLYEERRFIEADPDRAIEEGWRAATCAVTLYSVTGQRRNFVGVSAIHVFDSVEGFLRAQSRWKEDAPGRFVVSKVPTPEVEIVSRPSSEEDSRQRYDLRREIAFSPTGAAVGAEDSRR